MIPAAQVNGSSLIMERSALGADLAGPAQAQSNVTTVGVVLDGGKELLLLGPDGAQAASSTGLLEQLGLQASSGLQAAERSMRGLGGGWKRFVWEEAPRAQP